MSVDVTQQSASFPLFVEKLAVTQQSASFPLFVEKLAVTEQSSFVVIIPGTRTTVTSQSAFVAMFAPPAIKHRRTSSVMMG